MTCECGCGEETRLAPKTITARGLLKGEPLRFVNGHNARMRTGSNHPQWKGDDAGYMAVHNWLRRSLSKSEMCEACGKEGKTDWANISGEYRRDRDDYYELCRSCHIRLDRGV